MPDRPFPPEPSGGTHPGVDVLAALVEAEPDAPSADPGLRAAAEHTEACTDCTATVDALLATADLLRTAPVAAPADVRSRALAAALAVFDAGLEGAQDAEPAGEPAAEPAGAAVESLDGRRRAVASRRRPPVWLLAAAVVLALLALTPTFLGSLRTEERDTVAAGPPARTRVPDTTLPSAPTGASAQAAEAPPQPAAERAAAPPVASTARPFGGADAAAAAAPTTPHAAVAPTTVAPTTVAPTTVAPTTASPPTAATSTAATPTGAPTTVLRATESAKAAATTSAAGGGGAAASSATAAAAPDAAVPPALGVPAPVVTTAAPAALAAPATTAPATTAPATTAAAAPAAAVTTAPVAGIAPVAPPGGTPTSTTIPPLVITDVGFLGDFQKMEDAVARFQAVLTSASPTAGASGVPLSTGRPCIETLSRSTGSPLSLGSVRVAGRAVLLGAGPSGAVAALDADTCEVLHAPTTTTTVVGR